jgi:hypothetical protein
MNAGLGQTPTFTDQTDLLTYCAANPTLQAGYSPGGGGAQVLDCSEWPTVLPPTVLGATTIETVTTASGCFQLFGVSEPCIGPIGQYTLLVLIAVGLGLFWMGSKK